ncbi:MAG: hypothetical protein AVDCRST_MAG68-1210, partial [uncultured Gemmatimonadetes bacterium]
DGRYAVAVRGVDRGAGDPPFRAAGGAGPGVLRPRPAHGGAPAGGAADARRVGRRAGSALRRAGRGGEPVHHGGERAGAGGARLPGRPLARGAGRRLAGDAPGLPGAGEVPVRRIPLRGARHARPGGTRFGAVHALAAGGAVRRGGGAGGRNRLSRAGV